MNQPGIIELQVEGMTCTNCAATVKRKLERDGMQDIQVDFASGEVRFRNPTGLSVNEVIGHIDELGYKVLGGGDEKKNG